MRKHYISLLLLVIIIRLMMYLSYPMGLLDDNDHAQKYLIDQVSNGNYLVGNLRYNTGYPLVFGNLWKLSQFLGIQLQDRIFLVFQLSLAASIPFFVYAIISKNGRYNLAFFTAIVVAIEPFGLQWAHFFLPEWWIAFCFVVAIWAMQNDVETKKYHYIWISFAAILSGLASLSRLNVIPLVAVLGFALLFQSRFTLQEKLIRFTLFSMISAGIVGIYLLLIQYPSIGKLQVSCISNQARVVNLLYSEIPITVENGIETANYARLASLAPMRDNLTFYADSYPLWQIAGPWLSQEETSAFLQQEPPNNYSTRIDASSDSELYYYLGPCETDRLLGLIAQEAIAAQPIKWGLAIVRNSYLIISQYPKNLHIGNQYLPSPEQLEFSSEDLFGLQKATGTFYNGQWVWATGIQLYTSYFRIQWVFGVLYLPAVLWTLWKRDWFFTLNTGLVLGMAMTIAIFAQPEARYYADIYPMYSIIIGKLLFDIFNTIITIFQKRSTKS